MRRLRASFVLFLGLFRRRRQEPEMNAELQAHLDGLTERYIAKGMAADDARYAALREFGGLEQVKERARDERRAGLFESVGQDFRYGFRQLHKSPGVTSVAILSLAIGIGATTAILGVLDAVWWRALPVSHPDGLLLLNWKVGTDGKGTNAEVFGSGFTFDAADRIAGGIQFSLNEFRALEKRTDGLAGIFAWGGFGLPYVMVDGQAEDSGMEFVSGAYYRTLGLQPSIGRLLSPQDDLPNAPPVTVISHSYWQRRFGSDPGIIGKTVLLQNTMTTIVGVEPPQFLGLELGQQREYRLPLAMVAQVRARSQAAVMSWLNVMARPSRGVPRQAWNEGLQRAFRAFARETRSELRDMEDDKLPQLDFQTGAQGLTFSREGSERSFSVLGGLAALLLAITCVNIANLSLARGAAREKEIAVRIALGASRGRLIRQLLVETTLVAILGGAGAILVASWGIDLIVAMKPLGQWVKLPPVELDFRVLGFLFAITSGACICSGLWPACRATRFDPAVGFKVGLPNLGRTIGSALRMGNVLIAAQVAFCVMLLVVAGLLVRTLHNLRSVETGFERGGRLVFGIRAKPPGYSVAELAPMLEEVVDKLTVQPGVVGATFSRLQLFNWGDTPRIVFVDGGGASSTVRATVGTNDIAENFLATFRIPIVLGRDFDARDREGAVKVAIVNQAFVREYFPGRNPIGQRIGWGPENPREIEIVGVAGDTRAVEPRRMPAPMVYTPYRQQAGTRTYFAVRARGDPMSLLPLVRKTMSEVNPELLVAQIQSEAEILESFSVRERLIAACATFFGTVGVLLVCIGLYGLVSYSVLRRTKEIGIRMALGALPATVTGHVMRQFLRVVAGGILGGLLLAWAMARILETFLFGVSAADAPTYGITIFLLVIVSCIASWFPARRAAKVDPMVALRAE